MPPTPNALIKLIHDGRLLSAAHLASVDCDAVMDARDSDPEFEQEWLAARNSLSAKWEAGCPDSAAMAVMDDLRRESFLAVFTATSQRELSSYVSEDFELIGWASVVNQLPPVVAWLWESYNAGEFPRPDRRSR